MSVPRRARTRRSLPIAAVLAGSLGLAACLGAPAPPPPAPAPAPKPAPKPPPPPPGASSPCGVGTAEALPPASDTPIPPDEAETEAHAAVAASDARTPDGAIPLVTVELTDAGPEVTTTPVADAEAAAAVAQEAAADGDLVAVEVDEPVYALDHPPANDQFRSSQWALNNVKFEHAADNAPGGSSQVVAVIDTGVQQSHPDLGPGQVRAGESFRPAAEGPATTDLDGHGTHVAGIVAAIANNGVGITGAAPAAEILPVKVLGPDGKGFSSAVANGITWAANNDATVINLSLGGASAWSPAERSAIQYARDQGVVVVAAAGNDGAGGCASYPGAFPEVIAVGATTQANVRATFSTTGSYLDLAAPGQQILSTHIEPNPHPTINNQMYKWMSGTSMATPYVAAAAALTRAAHPEYTTHVAVCQQLVRTALDLGSTGHDIEYGHGLIRPDLAVGPTIQSGANCT